MLHAHWKQLELSQRSSDEREVLFASCTLGSASIVIGVLKVMAEHCSCDQMADIKTDAIYKSARSGNGEVMQLLLNGTTLTHDLLLKAFKIACVSGCSEAILPLLGYNDEKALSTEEVGAGLITSAGQGYMPLLSLLHGRMKRASLLQETLDVALNIASLNGHLETVAFLLRKSANPNAICEEAPTPKPDDEDDRPPWLNYSGSGTKRTSLQAALHGRWRIQHFAGYYGWHEANAAEREDIVLLLLEGGADVNLAFKAKSSLLHTAVKCCWAKVVQAMISHGASPADSHQLASQSHDSTSPAALAGSDLIQLQSEDEIYEIASSTSRTYSTLLNASGASRSEESLLHIAARREVGSVNVVKVLLQSGVELPNNPSGPNTVLLAALAYFSGNFRRSRPLKAILNDGPGGVVKFLLPRLPNERADNTLYGLLLQMAIAVHDVKCIKLLIERGFDVNLTGHYYGTALQCAARFAHLDLVQLLLHFGAKVNILGGKHNTALRAAVIAGNEAIVDILIAAGADANLRVYDGEARGQNSESMLHLAIGTKNHTIVKKIVDAGADVNVDIENRFSALTLAVESGNESVVRLLIDSNAVVDPPGRRPPHYYYFSDERASALHMACSKGYEMIAQLLIDHGADINLEIQYNERGKQNTTHTPIQVAALKGFLPVVRLVVLSGADINHCNCHGTALSIAAEENKVDIIEELLVSGASIKTHSHRSNVLAAACKSKNHEFIGLLVEELSGTPLEEATFTDALTSVASSGDDQTFKLLLDRGAPISSTTLSQACGASLHTSALALLERGVDVNGDVGDGERPIHLAAFQQRYAIVDLLLSCGANAEIETTKYGTPLQALTEGFSRFASGSRQGLGLPPEHSGNKDQSLRARSPAESIDFDFDLGRPYKKKRPIHECESVALLLIERQENMDTAERSFGTPLHLAAYFGSASCVQALLAKGANVNTTSDRFGTALMAALEGDNDAVIETLLHNGADPNHTSPKNGRPLQYACGKQKLNAVKLLLQHGADVNAVSDSHSTPFSAVISKIRSYSKYHIEGWDDDHGTRKDKQNREILEMLIDHQQDLSVTEDIMVTVLAISYDTHPSLANWWDQHKIVERLFEHNPDLDVTDAMLKTSQRPDDIKVLLKHAISMRISPEVLEAVSTTFRRAQELVPPLLEHDETVQVPQAVLDSRYDANPHKVVKFMTAVLERSPNLEISTELLRGIVCEPHYDHPSYSIKQKLAELFLRYEKRVLFTDKLRNAINKKFEDYPNMRELFYKLEDTTAVPAKVLAKKGAEAETLQGGY